MKDEEEGPNWTGTTKVKDEEGCTRGDNSQRRRQQAERVTRVSPLLPPLAATRSHSRDTCSGRWNVWAARPWLQSASHLHHLHPCWPWRSWRTTVRRTSSSCSELQVRKCCAVGGEVNSFCVGGGAGVGDDYAPWMESRKEVCQPQSDC